MEWFQVYFQIKIIWYRKYDEWEAIKENEGFDQIKALNTFNQDIFIEDLNK